jgi:2-polyprenyl-3-methyl-5-hydroxy-6-metoxy-1,4-benzoquinol methylase
VRDNLRFVRTMVETYDEPCDAVVFLQTIEHVQDPGAVLARFKALVERGGTVFVSTPNVLTLAPPGEARSGNPWHVYEYRPEEFHALCRAHFGAVEMYGLFHAGKLAVHAAALRLGWDAVHKRLGLTQAFYDRFVPALDARDFALRRGGAGDLHGALDLVAVLRA